MRGICPDVWETDSQVARPRCVHLRGRDTHEFYLLAFDQRAHISDPGPPLTSYLILNYCIFWRHPAIKVGD